MQFKYPEILYALLLLAIPIIIHLFQLRRFKKVAFTNVQFLKRITIQTRKSSQLKKWLTLLTRLLLFACIILAFAQPYFSNLDSFSTKKETVIYLDNSFSMQAKGDNGSLLNEAVQSIIERINPDEKLSIYTNNKTFKNATIKAITNDLIKLDHTPNQMSYGATIQKGEALFSDDKSSVKNLVLISDFQQNGSNINELKADSLNLKLVKLEPNSSANISIDSVYITKSNVENIELTATVDGLSSARENVSVSLYNGENLIAKSAVGFDESGPSWNSVVFTIPSNAEFNGRLSIDDVSLQYDNKLFFNISETERINVLSINQEADDFLEKLYSEDEFNYTSTTFEQLNYNEILNQNLVILNELISIPNSLINTLKKFTQDGGALLIIPSENAEILSYNQLFGNYGLSPYKNKITSEKKITDINFSHPLFTNVFDKRVKNFQYPKVNAFLSNSEIVSKSILSFENGQSFLAGSGNVFRFSAALNKTNSNFKNSPLIVPTLYNIGKQSLKLGNLYYSINTENNIDIPISIAQDDILTLENGVSSVIPLQRTYTNKVEITTNEYPLKAGIVSVKNKENIIKNLSFNFDRSESQLQYLSLDDLESASVSNSVAATIEDIKSDTDVNELWKWFVIFALVFLIVELLILKFLK
ncbi:MAG: BatA domain-containing protein [Bacteroidota bacterium]